MKEESKRNEKEFDTRDFVVPPECPFCGNLMEDLGNASWPVTPPDNDDSNTERHGRHCGGVWRTIREYVCHNCGYWAKFWAEFHKDAFTKYSHKKS